GVDWDAVRRVAFERDLVVDPEHVPNETLLGFLYAPEFSTEAGQTEIAGDGMGLARVKQVVEELYGTFVLESTPQQGTRVTITVPTYRALQRALLVDCAGRTWGIPEAAVIEVIPIGAAEISVTEAGMRLDWQGEFVPFGPLADVMGLEDDPGESVIVLSTPIGIAALSVGGVAGTREVAAKELGALLSGPQIVSGAALLGGDDVVLLIDAGRLAERLRDLADRPRGPVYKVLIVDDSKGVQQVVAGALASAGFSTVVAGSVSEALSALNDHEVNALVVDFSMPRADGVALVHMVRQRYGEMPIVMISGVANHEDVERAKKAGVDAFFDKGDFRKGALADTLRSLIELGM
ncbi:MAG: hybrid sensor histidine kinase/response regulator, partial [Actinobacteria bacterium]